MKRYIVLALLMSMLIGLLTAATVLPAHAQTATQTYTPIPTRTQTAATQAVTIITVDETPIVLDKRVTFGDVYTVVAIAAVFVLGAIAWAYQWVRSHIRTQEQ